MSFREDNLCKKCLEYECKVVVFKTKRLKTLELVMKYEKNCVMLDIIPYVVNSCQFSKLRAF